MGGAAFVDLESGIIHCTSEEIDLEEQIPEDLETSDRYLPIPNKNDFHLGRALVLSFIEDNLPNEYGIVSAYFDRAGAYARLKNFLDSKGLLDQWFKYENNAIELALRQWCKDNEIQISE